MKRKNEYAKIVVRISVITIIINLLLVVAKTVLGIIFSNLSVISDAIHSASDLFTSFLIIAAVYLSSPKTDKDHNYGHEKVEPLMTLFLALILAGVGAFLGYKGVAGIISPKPAEFNWYLVTAVVLSIAVKEWMFWYEIRWAKKLHSEMIRADAWHSRSDCLSSAAVLIGLIAGTFLETDIAESIAVLIVAGFIIKVAFDIFRPAVWQLVDKSADEQTCDRIREITARLEGVMSLDSLHTRMFGNKILADIEISVDKDMTVEQSHAIAEKLHAKLKSASALHIKDCTVHINPYEG